MFLEFTHKELVDYAHKWLVEKGGVGFAFKELKSLASEIPDVIGFNSSCSIVIECKACRSDFLQDKKKPHRQKGMGIFRFFFCPKGLIKPEELPEKWGLIYIAEDGSCRVVKEVRKHTRSDYDHKQYNPKTYWTDRYTNAFENDILAEQKVMYSALRRLQLKGYLKLIAEEIRQEFQPKPLPFNSTTVS